MKYTSALIQIILLCGSPSAFSATPRYVVLTGEEAKKALKQCSRSTPKNVEEFWTPTPELISRLESRFDKCIKHEDLKPLSKYQRQYIGLRKKDELTIYLNATLEESGAPPSHIANIICDGGSRSFGVEYSPADGLFSSLLFNSGIAGKIAGRTTYECGPDIEAAKLELKPVLANTLKTVTPIPVDSKLHLCANYSNDLWNAAQDKSGNVVMSLVDKRAVSRPSVTMLKLKGGTFVAKDMGEWGGFLKLVTKEGPEILYNKNVKFLIEISPTKVLALGGLAHLGQNDGIALEIIRSNEGWKIARQIPLSSSPQAIALKDDKILIAEFGRVSSIDISTIRQSTVADLSSNSLAIDSIEEDSDGNIFVGMNYAVAKLSKTGNGFKESWLVRRKCAGTKSLESVYE